MYHSHPQHTSYTAFIPLYPIGVVGEMAAVWAALPEIAARGLRSVRLPNLLNIAFDYALFLKVHGRVMPTHHSLAVCMSVSLRWRCFNATCARLHVLAGAAAGIPLPVAPTLQLPVSPAAQEAGQ